MNLEPCDRRGIDVPFLEDGVGVAKISGNADLMSPNSKASFELGAPRLFTEGVEDPAKLASWGPDPLRGDELKVSFELLWAPRSKPVGLFILCDGFMIKVGVISGCAAAA